MNSFVLSLLAACCAWLVHASSYGRFTNVYLTSDFQRAFEIDAFPSFAVSMIELDEDFRLQCSENEITNDSIVYLILDTYNFFPDSPKSRIIEKVKETKRAFFQLSGMEMKYAMPEIRTSPYLADYAAAYESEGIKFISNYTNIYDDRYIPTELNGIYLINFALVDSDILKARMNSDETALSDYVRENPDKLFIAPEKKARASVKPRASSPTENGNVAGTDAV